MKTTYKSIEVAERLMTSTNRDTWALADAVLADVPEMASGWPTHDAPRGASCSLGDRLDALVEAFDLAGIVTPNGDPYTTSALRDMRQTAMAWPAVERHDEAAYKTHQEAIGRTSERRAALAALAAFARGENPICPEQLDPDAFGEACTRLAAREARRRRRYPVAANDLRVATQRKPNVPTRENFTTPPGVLAGIYEATATVRRVGASVVSSNLDLTMEERGAIKEALDRLVDAVMAFGQIIEGVTDDALIALMEVDQ